MKTNIDKIEQKCLRILDICKGLETPLDTFYREGQSAVLSIQPLVSSLIRCLPDPITKEERTLYRYFFKSAILFLESSCPKEDQVLVSIKTISELDLIVTEGLSVFEIMINEAEKTKLNEQEKHQLSECRKNYKAFKRLSRYYKPDLFSGNVEHSLNVFARSHSLYLSDNDIQNLNVMNVLDFAINSIRDICITKE